MGVMGIRLVPPLRGDGTMRWALCLMPVGLILAGGAAAQSGPDEGITRPGVAARFEVESIHDIAYYEGKDADPLKHRLDVFLPKGKREFPVLFFIHGGAWRHGDKKYAGIYSTRGTFWAEHGVGAVLTNYRLTPSVTHPEHIKDVARAFAWTVRNIAKYGGRADRVFVSGHSAGGHLAALLATDESYLRAEGLGLEAVRGAIPMSGVFDLSERLGLFAATFGPDPNARRDAAPLGHVHERTPPFLIIYADHDFPLCGEECSERFCRALRGQHCDARTLKVRDRNHLTLLLDACGEQDPVAQAVFRFIADHTGS
jgi:acetyl esterase/lipase